MLTKFKTLAKGWAEDQKKRFPKSQNFRALTMCEKCYTFYYKNSWHFEKPEHLAHADDSTVAVKFTQCPACVEQELALYDMESGSFA